MDHGWTDKVHLTAMPFLHRKIVQYIIVAVITCNKQCRKFPILQPVEIAILSRTVIPDPKITADDHIVILCQLYPFRKNILVQSALPIAVGIARYKYHLHQLPILFARAHEI